MASDENNQPEDLGLNRLAISRPQAGAGVSVDDDVFQGGPTSLTITSPPSMPASSSMIPPEESPSRGNRANKSGEQRAPDAQEFYSSEFCVFVANLPQSETDEFLEAAVTQAFSRFGTVFVKIRRDTRNHMPYGFAQFTNAQHARNALMKGKGSMILGRACRTERVKGNCQFVIYRRDGSMMTRTEVTNIMEVQGELARVEPLHSQTQALTNLPETSWLVTYDLFDPRRDVVGAFANHMTYSARPFNKKENPEKSSGSGSGSSPRVFMDSYDLVRRSVFIANLPVHTTENIVRDLVGGFGRILSVHLRLTTYNGKIYAFVEFDRADIPDVVVARLNGKTTSDGLGFLRVQRRTKNTFEPNRAQGRRSWQHNANGPPNPSPSRPGPSPVVTDPITDGGTQQRASLQETPVKRTQQSEPQAATSAPRQNTQVTPTGAGPTTPTGAANTTSPMSSLSSLSPLSPWVHTSPYASPYAASLAYPSFTGSQYPMMTPQSSPTVYYQQNPQPQFSPFVMTPQMPAAYYTGSWSSPGYLTGGYTPDLATHDNNSQPKQDTKDHGDNKLEAANNQSGSGNESSPKDE